VPGTTIQLIFPAVIDKEKLFFTYIDDTGLTFKVFIELDALFNFRSAKAAIDHIIANEGNGPHRGPPGPHQQHHGGGGGGGGGSGFFEMMVAGHKVSAIQNLFFSWH